MANKKVAQIQTFVETHRSNNFWIGMDVHKKSYYIALKTNENECQTWVCSADPERFAEKIKGWNLHIRGVAYEAGPTGFALARTLKAAGFQVTVAAPGRIPRPVTPGAKTDRLDCIKLADYLRRGMLKPIAVPTRSQEHDKTVRCLQSVPGVGPVVSTTFRLELFDPERFSRAEEVTSYLGLAPMVRQSGERSSQGRLRPVGQKRLRSLLIEAAWTFRAKVPWAREFYNKRFSKTGLAQKAIVALARKLAVILWRLSVEQRPFRPVVKVNG